MSREKYSQSQVSQLANIAGLDSMEERQNALKQMSAETGIKYALLYQKMHSFRKKPEVKYKVTTKKEPVNDDVPIKASHNKVVMKVKSIAFENGNLVFHL